MSASKYALGLDYGTNSVRTLIVNVANGREVASAIWTDRFSFYICPPNSGGFSGSGMKAVLFLLYRPM